MSMSLDTDRAPSVSFDRTPPQDVAAEQCVLGAMMLSKDAIADVVERIKEEDFYMPAHQTVYRIILDLYSRGEPADEAVQREAGSAMEIVSPASMRSFSEVPPLTAAMSPASQL